MIRRVHLKEFLFHLLIQADDEAEKENNWLQKDNENK